jgi:hypothetical protein
MYVRGLHRSGVKWIFNALHIEGYFLHENIICTGGFEFLGLSAGKKELDLFNNIHIINV